MQDIQYPASFDAIFAEMLGLSLAIHKNGDGIEIQPEELTGVYSGPYYPAAYAYTHFEETKPIHKWLQHQEILWVKESGNPLDHSYAIGMRDIEKFRALFEEITALRAQEEVLREEQRPAVISYDPKTGIGIYKAKYFQVRKNQKKVMDQLAKSAGKEALTTPIILKLLNKKHLHEMQEAGEISNIAGNIRRTIGITNKQLILKRKTLFLNASIEYAQYPYIPVEK